MQKTEKKCKVLVNLDWLSMSFIVQERKDYEINDLCLNEIPGYVVEKCSGTNVFKNRFIVYDENGIKKLTVLTDPKSHLMYKELCIVEFANHTLYTGEFVELFNVMHRLHDGFFHGLSRVDVCCDFQQYYNEYGEVTEGKNLSDFLLLNMYYIQHKKEGAAFYEYDKQHDVITTVCKQLSWGSKKSAFKWKLYNKSKEIREESHKVYIEQIWNLASFDLNKDTWRLECSIQNANKYKVCNVKGENLLSFDKLADKESLHKLFVYLMTQRFVCRRNEGQKNSSRNRIIDLFSFGTPDCTIKLKTNISNYVPDTALRFVRQSVKNLQDIQFCRRGLVLENLIKTIQEVLETYSIYDWFEQEYNISFNDFYFFAYEQGGRLQRHLTQEDGQEKETIKQLTIKF